MVLVTINDNLRRQLRWQAVLGRNFSIKHKHPLPLFDDKLVGWGFEHTDFAIQLLLKGVKNVRFCATARVVQIDDFQKSSDPFKNSSNIRIAQTQANNLYLMRKYKKYPKIYCELGSYLLYFALPFDFKHGKFILNKRKQKKFHTLFSNKYIPSYNEATDWYKSTFHNLKVLSKMENIKLSLFR